MKISSLRPLAQCLPLEELPSPVGVTPISRPAGLPTPVEIDRLLAIVEAAWPRLQPTDEEPHHRAAFVLAMHRVTFSYRTDRLDASRGLDFFMSECNEWLARYGLGRVSAKAFTAACAASGIRMTTLSRWPFDVEFCLSAGDGKATDAWRTVLALGGLQPPLPPRRPPVLDKPLHIVLPSREDRLRPGRVD